MTLSPIAGPLLSEQVELIREIARNLVGEAGPAGARLPAQEPGRLPDGASPGSGNTPYGSAAGQTGGSAASLSLIGLRPAFAGQSDPAVSQGAETRRLLQLLARGTAAPAPAAEGTAAAREGAASSTPGTRSAATVPADGGVKTASQSGMGEIPGNRGIGMPGSVLVAAGAAAAAHDAGIREQAAASAAGSPGRQAHGEDAQTATRTAYADPTQQASAPFDKAGMPSQAPADPTGAVNPMPAMPDLESTLRTAIAERSLAALGLGDIGLQMAAQAASAAPERAGVIASFILNAHFQPGWPPLRPIQGAQAAELAGQLAQAGKLIAGDKEMLVYLANFGVNIEQIARILKLLPRARHRSKLLAAILGFLVNFSTIMRLLQEELSALLDDLGAESQLLPCTVSGKRLRTDLR